MLLLERKHAANTSMGRREIYLSRMEQLGWSEYRLCQEIVKLRQARGEETTLQKLQSSINKALKEPEGRATYINDDIVNALGGEFIIRWKQFEDVKL
jgi:hypothetical protein